MLVRAGDELCLLAREEDHDLGNVLGAAEATERDVCEELCVVLGRVGHAGERGGEPRSREHGGNAVETDVVRRIFDSETLGDGRDGRLTLGESAWVQVIEADLDGPTLPRTTKVPDGDGSPRWRKH